MDTLAWSMQLSIEEIGRPSVDEHLGLIGQLRNRLEREVLTLNDARQRELDRRSAVLDAERAEGLSRKALRDELAHRCP